MVPLDRRKMISYFEKQLAEFNHAIHSLDEKMFEKWVEESVRLRALLEVF